MWDYISTPTTKYARLKLELPSATEVPKEGLTCSCTSPNKIPQHIFLGLGVDALHAHARTRMLVNLSARARTRASRRKCASRQLTFRNHKTKKLETKAHHSNPRMFRVSHRLSTKMLLFRGHPHSNHKIGSSSKVRGTLFAQWPCPRRAVEPKLPSSAPWQSVCELPCRQQGWGGTASPSLFVERTTTAPSRFL